MVDRLKFKASNGAHHNGAGQLGFDACIACAVTLHFNVVRANISKGFAVLHVLVLWTVEADCVVAPNQHFAFVGAAMEQVNITQEAIHKGAGGMVPHLLGGANLFHTATVHEHHTVCHFQSLFLVVRHKDTGDMQIVVQAAQPAAQFFAHFGIEGAKRFIEQQDFGLNGQGACQGYALTLTA